MKIIRIQTSKLKLEINSKGAELSSIKNFENLEYLWQASPAVWPRHAPVLFPIVGKLKNDQYTFNEKDYTLSQHGFARDRLFEVIEQGKSSCTFELKSDSETILNYPFDFKFQIHYSLNENTLVTKYTVFNSSSRPIYFSLGAHPGFRCPLLENESFEDYYLGFEHAEYSLTELENGLRKDNQRTLRIPNKTLDLQQKLFDNDALVFENSQINKVKLLSKKSNHGVILESTNWPYFGIWSKKESKEFICLEPWFGIADKNNTSQNLVQKEGMIKLEPKKEFICSFSLTFL